MRRLGRGRERPDIEAVRDLLAGTDPLPVLEEDAHLVRPAWLVLDKAMLATTQVDEDALTDDRDDIGALRGAGDGAGQRAVLTLAVRSVAAVAVVALAVSAWPGAVPEAAAGSTPDMLVYELTREESFLTADGEPASATLLELAGAAQDRLDPVKGGPVQKVRSVAWVFHQDFGDDDIDAQAVIPKEVVTRVRPDGLVVRSERLGSGLLTGADAGSGAPAPEPTASSELVASTRFSASLLDLTDPVRLRARVLSDYGCATSSAERQTRCLLSSATAIRSVGAPSGDFDAATWRMLASEPGLIVLGDVTDRAGRAGVAITTSPHAGDDTRPVIVIDPVSGRMLSSELVAVSETAGYPVEVPAVVEFTAVLSATWVNDTLIRP